MSRERYLRWRSEPPRPKHGYKDTAFVYLFLCAIVVLFAWLSGGSVVKGVIVAGVLFVVGSIYSLVRWHDFVRHLRGRDGERS